MLVNRFLNFQQRNYARGGRLPFLQYFVRGNVCVSSRTYYGRLVHFIGGGHFCPKWVRATTTCVVRGASKHSGGSVQFPLRFLGLIFGHPPTSSVHRIHFRGSNGEARCVGGLLYGLANQYRGRGLHATFFCVRALCRQRRMHRDFSHSHF